MRKVFVIAILFTWVFLSAQVSLDPRYHTYEEIIEELFAYQDSFPEIVMVQEIGQTTGAPYQNPIPIYAIKLSNNAAIDEDEPALMFAGQCHAEEVLGVEITMYMIQQIIQMRFVQPYSIWLQSLEMWFVPTYNPEGLQVVMDDWDVTYRKNKRDNDENGFFNYAPGGGGDVDGVDPNRNYGFNWIHGEVLYGGSGEEWNDYYRGPYPFSEGGTQAIRALADQQHFIYSINWHSSRTGNFSEKVYYPFNWEEEKACPDLPLHQSIGESVAELIVNENGVGTYQAYASQGRKGNAHDWFYKAHGTCQLLIECGTQNLQPTNAPPNYLIDDTCQRCSLGAYWLMNRAIGYNTEKAMLTGHISDSATGDPLVARYIIEELDAGFFDPRFSDELYGRYWKPVSPGTYTLRIAKKGYEEELIENVTVNSSAWKIEDVELNPLSPVTVSGNITSNGQPIAAEIIVSNGNYIPADTVEVISGNYSFDNFEGDHEVVVKADGCVPQKHMLTLSGTTLTFNADLAPAVVVFEEDWEDDLSGWTVTGDWALTDNSILGDYSVTDSPDEFYANSSTAVLKTNSPINFGGVSSDAALVLWHKYHTEHDNDFCKIEYSSDGNNWTALKMFAGVSDGWKQDTIFVPELAQSGGYIYLRFVLNSDDSVDDPGWWIDDVQIVASTGASAGNNLPPAKTRLYKNYPNPFNPSTCIKYSLASDSVVDLSIYNIKGQKVRTIVNAKQQAGEKEFIWSGEDDSHKSVTSGIYFYTLLTSEFSQTKKMILLK